jgi:hypothetical protein
MVEDDKLFAEVIEKIRYDVLERKQGTKLLNEA